MRIDQALTDGAVLRELGERFARLRLQRNLTQRQLAEEAGVDRKVVLRLEAGEPVQLVTLVRLLRALGHLGALDALLAPPQPSPMELLELRGRPRQRARPRSTNVTGTPSKKRTAGPRSRQAKPPDGDDAGPWRWGDER